MPVCGPAMSTCGTTGDGPAATARCSSSLRPPSTKNSSSATAKLTAKLAPKVASSFSGRPALATTPLVMPP